VWGHSILHLAVLGFVKPTLGSGNCTSFSCMGFHRNSVWVYFFPHSFQMPCLFHDSSFYYAANLWLELDTAKLLIMQSSLHVSPK
jgi:hypothetical protein